MQWPQWLGHQIRHQVPGQRLQNVHKVETNCDPIIDRKDRGFGFTDLVIGVDSDCALPYNKQCLKKTNKQMIRQRVRPFTFTAGF